MSIVPRYAGNGKWYQTPRGYLVSAGKVVSTLTGETFDHIPLDTLKMAEQEGTGAHRIGCDLALLKLGHLEQVPVPDMPVDYPGSQARWVDAMARAHVDLLQWFEEYEVEPIAVEEPSTNYAYGFAGCPDLKAWYKPKRAKRKRMGVFDYKRVAAVGIGHRLKLLIYKTLDGYKDCEHGVIVWIKKEGGITPIPVPSSPSDEAALLGQAAAIRWQQMHGYLKAPV